MIIRNELPILEYDDTSKEVIAPDHEAQGLHLPEKCVFAFVGEAVDEYASLHKAVMVDTFETITKHYPIYVGLVGGEEICFVAAPSGAAAAAQILDCLIACGVKKIIVTGSCGVLADIEENKFLVVKRALRDEGTSYAYLPPARYIDLDEEGIEVIKKTLEARSHPYEEVMTWSTDGFFRETKDMVTYRLEEGCSCVEMECSALAAVARKRGAKLGQVLFTADSLANVHEYDLRGFGMDSHMKALELAFEIIHHFE